MFFTQSSRQFESGLIGEEHKRDEGAVAQKHSAGLAEAIKRDLEYSTDLERRGKQRSVARQNG